jgi:hypothetical protein
MGAAVFVMVSIFPKCEDSSSIRTRVEPLSFVSRDAEDAKDA